MTDIFDRICSEYDALKEKHDKEVKYFVRTRFSNSEEVKNGLLNLLEKLKKDSRFSKDKVVGNFSVKLTRRVSADISESGIAFIHWDDGYVTEYMDERFKQSYEHLRELYETRSKRIFEGEEGFPF